MTVSDLQRILSASGIGISGFLFAAPGLPEGQVAVVVLFPYILPDEENVLSTHSDVDVSSGDVGLEIASFAARNHYAALVRILKGCVGQFRRLTGLPRQAFRIAVNSEFPEKNWATAAGLGFIGRSSLLVSPVYGAACIIGAILMPADCIQSRIEAERGSAGQVKTGPSCGACQLCVLACPSRAISPDNGYQRTACIQHWTGREEWPERIAAVRGPRLYGCDECIVACPWTRRRNPEAVLAAHRRLLEAECRPGRRINATFLTAATEDQIRQHFKKTALGFSWLPVSALRNWARYCLRGREPA